ncbi:hypothetical protein MUK42_01167, partial [Musa troglodytarum]
LRTPLLTPSLHSLLELTTIHNKCSTTSPDPFTAMLALCSNSLMHNDNDVDELWLVFDTTP